MKVPTQTISHLEADALFEAAGATGIRHRARRAVYEKRIDPALASQIVTVATELEADPRFVPIAGELRLHAAALQPQPVTQWSGTEFHRSASA